MKEKTKLALLAILDSVCALLWIVDIVQYLPTRAILLDTYAQPDTDATLAFKILVAFIWLISAIITLIRYVKFQENSTDTEIT